MSAPGPGVHPDPGAAGGVPRVEPAGVAALRADLDSAGYTVDGAVELLGPLAAAALAREQPLPARRACAAVLREGAGGSRAARATLIRLFTLGGVVDPAELDAALPRLTAAGAARLGLVARADGAAAQPGPAATGDRDGLVATVDLRPYGDGRHTWWVVSDRSELATGHPVAPDHVLGLGGASATLAAWTPRRPVASALDLGTGCGVQSLHLATHAREVTATDISSRALGFTSFTAALSGQSWRLLAGSLLEPVAGQRFELVVSNPPFVITPRISQVPTFTYRDGGRVGDGVVAELVTGMGEVLEPGGVAQFLANWEVGQGRDWRERVGSWVRASGLDAWVVQRDVQDGAQYAELWARDGGHRGDSAASAGMYETMYAAWLDDFEARGVAGVGFGVITLQRPATPRAPFVDLIEASGPVAPVMGPAVDAGLAARTWLAEHDERELLARHWRLAGDVTQERHYRPGEDDPAVIQLRQGGGLGLTRRLDTVDAAYAGVADGQLSAEQAATAIAAVMGAPVDTVRASLAATVRECVRDGFLVD